MLLNGFGRKCQVAIITRAHDVLSHSDSPDRVRPKIDLIGRLVYQDQGGTKVEMAKVVSTPENQRLVVNLLRDLGRLAVVGADLLVKVSLDIPDVGGGHGDHDEGAEPPGSVPGHPLVGHHAARHELHHGGRDGEQSPGEMTPHGDLPVSGGVKSVVISRTEVHCSLV